jgi:arginine deiminase
VPLQVDSEVGRLRRVLVHEPGVEVDLMVPAMMEQLLFDDILYGERARDEHGRFRRVLQLFGIEVHDASDLLATALELPEARRWLLDALLDDLPGEYLRQLEGLSAAQLASRLVTGQRRTPGSPGSRTGEPYGIPPLPNWCFQRDTQVILGSGVVFCSMAAPARHREALLSRVLFRFHPDLSGVPVWFEPLQSDPQRPLLVGQQRPNLEGGDVLVLSPEVVVVGLSERTNRTAVNTLARTLGSATAGGPRFMIVVQIPRRRAYMHLDTLFTVVDRDACLVHAPVMLPGGPEAAQVFEIDLRSAHREAQPRDDLLGSLARHGIDLEPIPCGGDDLVDQQREQWTDGSNALAVAPGVITLFDRNVETAEQLDRRGFRVIEAEDLLLGREEIDIDSCGRACVLIRSHEISRARGGPHCLTHPLRRDPVPG